MDESMTYAQFVKQYNITHAQAAALLGYKGAKSLAVSHAFSRDFPKMLDEWHQGVLHKRPNTTHRNGWSRDYQRINLALSKIILHKSFEDLLFADGTTPGEVLRINDFLNNLKEFNSCT